MILVMQFRLLRRHYVNPTDYSQRVVISARTDCCMPTAAEYFPGMKTGSRFCGGRRIRAAL